MLHNSFTFKVAGDTVVVWIPRNTPEIVGFVVDFGDGDESAPCYFQKTGGRLLDAFGESVEYAKRYVPHSVKAAQRIKNAVQRKLAQHK